MYIDTRAMDVRVVVGIKIGFRGEDAGDGDESDDENWVRYSCSSPLEVMLTGSDGAKSGAEDRDVYQAP